MANLNAWPNQDDTTFDLFELFTFFWTKKFRIIISASLIVLAGSYYIFSLPNIYTAKSSIFLGEEKQGFSLSSSVANFAGSDSKFDTYLEFIRSRQFIGLIVDHFGLTDDPEFRPKFSESKNGYMRDYAIDILLENLSLNQKGDTYLLQISFKSQSPQRAAEVANFLGPRFFEYYAQRGKRESDSTYEWLNIQLVELESKLAQAQQNLQNFLTENQLTDMSSQQQLAQLEISALMQERLSIEQRLAPIDSAVYEIEQARGDQSLLLQIPLFQNNPRLIRLREKITVNEQHFSEVKKRYKYKHHKYTVALSMLESLIQSQSELFNELIASLRQGRNILQARKQIVSEQLTEAKGVYSKLATHELQLERLRREAESTQSMYELFVARLQETEIVKGMGSTEQFSVVDRASIPVTPSQPRFALLLVLLLFFAFTLSTGFWLILHLISDKTTKSKQILHRMGIPILAEVPKLTRIKRGASIKSVINDGQDNYQFSEAIRSLRASILVRPGEVEKRIIAVTGVKAKDGKSSITVSLAKSFGKLEKTLLVDTNLRRPQIAKAFDLADFQPGITSFVGREALFKNCVIHEKDSQLIIMPSGPLPLDPNAFFSKPRFIALIKKLGILYERIIFEVPSVLEYSDGLVLSKYVDAVILVVDTNATAPQDLLDSIQKLQDSGAPILGVVFNRVKNIRGKFGPLTKSEGFFNKVLGK